MITDTTMVARESARSPGTYSGQITEIVAAINTAELRSVSAQMCCEI